MARTGRKLPEKELEEILYESNTERKDKINFDEFCKVMEEDYEDEIIE